MKISKSIGDKFPYMHYQSETPNKNLVIVIHGLGEVGSADGSSLSRVEQPNTYAKHASNGVEFPFNIIAPQLAGWNPVDMVTFINQVSKKHGYTKVFITGLSGGGEITWKMLDPAYTFIPEIAGIAPVSGKWREGIAKACTLRDVPIYAWHNIGDTIMPWSKERGGEELLIDALMKCTNRKIKPITEIMASSSHDAWTKAYEVGGKLQKFIEGLFGNPEVIKDDVISSYYDGVNLVFETKSGKVIKK
jgi:predicted peptidase